MDPGTVLVSVVVPVRDNADGVREVLRCLSAQSVGRGAFEVIVGDEGSRDSLSGPELDDAWVTVVAGPPKSSYAARNRAISVARGDVLAFCDSDCRPEHDWLEQGLAALRDADIVAGEVAFDAPDRPTVWSLLTVDQFLDQRRASLLGVAATANMFVARRVFARVGGFDESLPSGGDWEFVRRATAAGARLDYTPRAIVRHPTLDGSRALLRKVWLVNRWAETRRARAGVPAFATRGGLVTALAPFYGAARERRRTLRPVAALDLDRIGQVGIATSRWQRTLGIAAIYVFVATTVRLAQLHGRVAWRIAGGKRPATIGAVELGSDRLA